MAVRDFTANQIRTAKLIMTGSSDKGGLGYKNLELAIYSESVAPDELGTTPAGSPYEDAGNDVSIFVSGSQTARGGSTGGVTLFEGDVYLTGSLVVQNAGRSAHGASISGSIHHTHTGASYLKAGTGITIASGSANGGQVTISSNAEQNVFQTIDINDNDSGFTWGTNNITSDQASDTLKFVAGTNITLNSDTSADAIRISSTCCDDPVVANIQGEIKLSTNANGDLTDSNIDSSPNKSFEIDVRIGPTVLDYDGVAATDSTFPSANNKFKIHYAGIFIEGRDISGGGKANSAFTKAIAGDVFTVTHTAGSHKIFDFDISEASDVVKFQLQNVTGGTNHNIDSAYASATNRWDSFKIVIPLLIKDSNGNTQTIKVGTSISKSRKGETGARQPKVMIRPPVHILSVDAAGEVLSSEAPNSTSGPVTFRYSVFGDTTYQLPAIATSLPDEGSDHGASNFSNPAASKYHVNVAGARVRISSLTSGNNMEDLTGAKAVYDDNQTLKIIDAAGSDIVSFHLKVVSNNLTVVLKQVHSNNFVYSSGQAAQPWKAIEVSPALKATDASGNTFTVDPGAPFTIVKTKFTPARVGLRSDPQSLAFQANAGGAIVSGQIDGSDATNNAFFEFEAIGPTLVSPQNNSDADGVSGLANNKYNLNLVSIGSPAFANVYPVSADPVALALSYNATTDVLTLTNSGASHVVATLKYVKSGNQARLHVASLSDTYDGSGGNWGAIKVKLTGAIQDNVGNQTDDVPVDIGIVKNQKGSDGTSGTNGKDGLQASWTNDIIVPSLSNGQLAIDMVGITTRNPGSILNIDSPEITRSSFRAGKNGDDGVGFFETGSGTGGTGDMSNNRYFVDVHASNVKVKIIPDLLLHPTEPAVDGTADFDASNHTLLIKGADSENTNFMYLVPNHNGSANLSTASGGLGESFFSSPNGDAAALNLTQATSHVYKNASGADKKWSRVVITFQGIRVKDSSGNVSTAVATLNVKKQREGTTWVLKTDVGDDISAFPELKAGDIVFRTTDQQIFKVTDSMLSQSTPTLAAGNAVATPDSQLGAGKLGCLSFDTSSKLIAIGPGSSANTTGIINAVPQTVTDGNGIISLQTHGDVGGSNNKKMYRLAAGNYLVSYHIPVQSNGTGLGSSDGAKYAFKFQTKGTAQAVNAFTDVTGTVVEQTILGQDTGTSFILQDVLIRKGDAFDLVLALSRGANLGAGNNNQSLDILANMDPMIKIMKI